MSGGVYGSKLPIPNSFELLQNVEEGFLELFLFFVDLDTVTPVAIDCIGFISSSR